MDNQFFDFVIGPLTDGRTVHVVSDPGDTAWESHYPDGRIQDAGEFGGGGSLPDGTVEQIIAMGGAATADGGFVITQQGREERPGSPDHEFLVTLVFNPVDKLVGELDVDVPGVDHNLATSAITGFTDYALSDARLAILYQHADGAVVTPQLTLEPIGADTSLHTDFVLPGAPTATDQTSADLALTFAGGDRLMLAGPAHPNVTGGAGDDTIIGGAPHDVLRGGDGNDSILGGSGFDDINGNKGDDTIAGGGSGSDWLVGGQGNDLITGQGDFSILYGNLGNDTLQGGSGGEWLRGGQGDDLISGGGGDDWISGDRGNDTETGGSGADTFNGFSGIGTDRILDFHTSEGDRVQLDPGTHFTIAQVGADTIVDLGAGDRMVLVGVDMTSLTPGWIFGF